MVSLYVCDFPQDLSSDDIKDIFGEFDGFTDVRIAKDKNG
jgi:RNA recognition motif-containing protein